MTGDDQFEYNFRAIRELLLAAYSADELRALIAYDKELGLCTTSSLPMIPSSFWLTRRSATARAAC